eukprot:TRINITY_DN49923_c0_g1_i1.p1 TRINITY_DN49923_c0_g1~~TRINITY_DN49923_c0_g1_i1.p1  ORF type:complete len:162 (-),score=32.44 TRINITY_DN49923_c0_g1_i1:56-541(-)
MGQQVGCCNAEPSQDEDVRVTPIAAVVEAQGNMKSAESQPMEEPQVEAVVTPPEPEKQVFPQEEPEKQETVPPPKEGVTMKFGTENGKEETVTFTKRPLGMDFDKRVPIIMKRVTPNGHGYDLGVKAGWTLLAVNGEDITGMQFEQVYNLLLTHSSPLPTA